MLMSHAAARDLASVAGAHTVDRAAGLASWKFVDRRAAAGFNCAEAVNFGPPDWLPYGTDRAQKYRGDLKPLTLSHDALLVCGQSAFRA